VDEPKLHLWETGVTRITRHPQSFGQALWCFAHTLWIGACTPPLLLSLLPCFQPRPWALLPWGMAHCSGTQSGIIYIYE
jgi:hypothetical protein